MTAVGYTDGDPRKVSVSGDTMTGALELPGDPTAGDEAATKHYVDTHGGGGGGVPSDTVVTETAFGQAADAGTDLEYSRGDHTHGTPPAPDPVPDPADAVVAGTSYGLAPVVGTSLEYAREDHSHGTPAAAAVPAPAGAVVSETAFGQSPAVGTGVAFARDDHTHGTPAAPAVPAAGNTVVTEQAFGQGSGAGVAATFSRTDHTHGTPAAPAVPTPANAIVTEQTYGQASAIGVNTTEFAREDHTHGTPALPTAAQVGADPAGSAAAAQSAAQAYADGVAAAAQAAAEAYADGVAAAAQAAAEAYADGVAAAAQAAAQAYTDTQVAASRVYIDRSGIITTGAVNCALGSPTQVGPDLTVSADAGDIIAVGVRALSFDSGGALYWNAATRVSGTDTNYFGDGTGSWPFPQGGISGWYTPPGEFTGPRGLALYTVQVGDIVAGAVTVRIYGQPEGSDRAVQATAGQPFESFLINLRQAS